MREPPALFPRSTEALHRMGLTLPVLFRLKFCQGGSYPLGDQTIFLFERIGKVTIEPGTSESYFNTRQRTEQDRDTLSWDLEWCPIPISCRDPKTEAS